jgi:hypothetical protein
MSLSKSPRRASRKNRFPISLSHRLDHKLLGYAAAASAAGVGMMALVQTSQAEVVYTPTQQTIKVRGTLAIDLNNDGVTDFTFYNAFSSCNSQPPSKFAGGPPECSEHSREFLSLRPNGLNGVVGGSRWQSALPAGKKVGLGDNFGAFGLMAYCGTLFGPPPFSSGPWRNVKNLYLGLAFSIDGQTHYGWARVTVTVKPGTCKATVGLSGYAYETVPGKAIPTGKTLGTDEVSEAGRPEATLGALALGSAGLVAWRREEETDGRGI